MPLHMLLSIVEICFLLIKSSDSKFKILPFVKRCTVIFIKSVIFIELADSRLTVMLAEFHHCWENTFFMIELEKFALY